MKEARIEKGDTHRSAFHPVTPLTPREPPDPFKMNQTHTTPASEIQSARRVESLEAELLLVTEEVAELKRSLAQTEAALESRSSSEVYTDPYTDPYSDPYIRTISDQAIPHEG